MQVQAAQAALSGFQAAAARLQSSAHNVANLQTEDFHPLRTVTVAEAGGGTRALTTASAEPEGVDLAAELVEQFRARAQAGVSVRVLAVDARVHESTLDLLA